MWRFLIRGLCLLASGLTAAAPRATLRDPSHETSAQPAADELRGTRHSRAAASQRKPRLMSLAHGASASRRPTFGASCCAVGLHSGPPKGCFTTSWRLPVREFNQPGPSRRFKAAWPELGRLKPGPSCCCSVAAITRPKSLSNTPGRPLNGSSCSTRPGFIAGICLRRTTPSRRLICGAW